MAIIHIIGGGLAGLSAAVKLHHAGRQVALYESSGHWGGRCRSYHDPQLGCELDNGNHLVLGANKNVFHYLHLIQAREALTSIGRSYRYSDLDSGDQWRLRPPFYLPPGGMTALWKLLPLLRAHTHQTVAECIDPTHRLARHYMIPLCESVLNTPIHEASARMLGQVMLKVALGGGEGFVPRTSLGDCFIAPALSLLQTQEHRLQLNCAVKSCVIDNTQIVALKTATGTVALEREDHVILATPPWVSETLLPDLSVPCTHHPILNIHFRFDHGYNRPAIQSVVGGVTQWIFFKPGLLSTTTSAAGDWLDHDKNLLAERVWNECAQVLQLGDTTLPPYRVVWEKRATFACTPEVVASRPPTRTSFSNLMLAGDYTDTGLPATIEGTILSGFRAAEAVLTAS